MIKWHDVRVYALASRIHSNSMGEKKRVWNGKLGKKIPFRLGTKTFGFFFHHHFFTWFDKSKFESNFYLSELAELGGSNIGCICCGCFFTDADIFFFFFCVYSKTTEWNENWCKNQLTRLRQRQRRCRRQCDRHMILFFFSFFFHFSCVMCVRLPFGQFFMFAISFTLARRTRIAESNVSAIVYRRACICMGACHRHRCHVVHRTLNVSDKF